MFSTGFSDPLCEYRTNMPMYTSGTAGANKRSVAFALGDFDGDAIRVGEPEYHPAVTTSRPTVVLAAVSSRGARAKIRRRLNRLGLVETRDYWCVA